MFILPLVCRGHIPRCMIGTRPRCLFIYKKTQTLSVLHLATFIFLLNVFKSHFRSGSHVNFHKKVKIDTMDQKLILKCLEECQNICTIFRTQLSNPNESILYHKLEECLENLQVNKSIYRTCDSVLLWLDRYNPRSVREINYN